jgi:hypothetical protein
LLQSKSIEHDFKLLIPLIFTNSFHCEKKIHFIFVGLGLQSAQPIRLLLEYTGMPWEDKRYPMGPAPDYDKSAWFKEKFTLGLDFPNVR